MATTLGLAEADTLLGFPVLASSEDSLIQLVGPAAVLKSLDALAEQPGFEGADAVKQSRQISGDAASRLSGVLPKLSHTSKVSALRGVEHAMLQHAVLANHDPARCGAQCGVGRAAAHKVLGQWNTSAEGKDRLKVATVVDRALRTRTAGASSLQDVSEPWLSGYKAEASRAAERAKQVEASLRARDVLKPLLQARACPAAGNVAAACEHDQTMGGQQCKQCRSLLQHQRGCVSATGGTTDCSVKVSHALLDNTELSCKEAASLLKHYDSHDSDAARAACSSCRLLSPSAAASVDASRQELNKLKGFLANYAMLGRQTAGGSSGLPPGALQHVGAALQLPLRATGGAFVTGLSAGAAAASGGAAAASGGAAALRNQRLQYGATFAHLSVLAAASVDPLLVDAASTGQLVSAAADRVRRELELAERAAQMRAAASSHAAEVASGDVHVRSKVLDVAAQEVELLRVAGAITAAHAEAKGKAAAFLANRNKTDAVIAAFNTAIQPYVAQEQEVSMKSGQLMVLNNALKATFQRYVPNWADAGAAGSGGAGVAYRMRMAAHKRRVLLCAADRLGSCDTNTGLESTAAGPTDWLHAVGARLPLPADVVPPAVSKAITQHGATAKEALASWAGQAGAAPLPTVDQPTFSVLAPAFNPHAAGPVGIGGAQQPAGPATAVAFMRDLVTQQLMSVLSGVIAVARARQAQQLAALTRVSGGGSGSAGSAVDAVLGAAAAASAAAAAASLPGALAHSVVGGPPPQHHHPASTGAGELQAPPEVRESVDSGVWAVWEDVKAQWRRWYDTERLNILNAARTGELPRQRGFMPSRTTMPDRDGEKFDPISGGTPAAAYRQIVAEACHRDCSRYFYTPLNRLADALLAKADADVAEFTPERIAAASAPASAGAGAAASAPGAAAPVVVGPPQPGRAGPEHAPGGLRKHLLRSLPITSDGRVGVSGAAVDAALLGGGGGGGGGVDARVTLPDFLQLLQRQLAGLPPVDEAQLPATLGAPAIRQQALPVTFLLDSEDESDDGEGEGEGEDAEGEGGGEDAAMDGRGKAGDSTHGRPQRKGAGQRRSGRGVDEEDAAPAPTGRSAAAPAGRGAGRKRGREAAEMHDEHTDGQSEREEDGGSASKAKRARTDKEGGASGAAAAAADGSSGAVDVEQLLKMPIPAAPKPQVFNANTFRARISALRGLSPAVAIRPRGAALCRWVLAQAQLRAALEADRPTAQPGHALLLTPATR